jgi:hypothetical protein
MRVEYLVAWEDGTWTTTIVSVPFSETDTDKLVKWANDNLGTQMAYRKVVLFAVYGVPAQEG